MTELLEPRSDTESDLRRQVATLTREVETLLTFLIEIKQWGASNCRCSFNAASLLEKLRRGVSTDNKEW